MNHPMSALSIQLLLYAVAWLVLGLGFQLNRRVVLAWSMAWFCAGVAALVLYSAGRFPQTNVDLWVNMLIIISFVCLQRGVNIFAGQPIARPLLLGAYAVGVLTVEVLRRLGPDWVEWRVALFTLLVCWPLAATARQILLWLKAQENASTAVAWLTVSPLVLSILIFVLRFGLVLGGIPMTELRFDRGSDFSQAVSLAFLVLLGGFNFSLASLVLGRLITTLRTLSDTDQLTGLYNRRMLMRRLDHEHARHLRGGQQFSILMLDIDHFKRINDSYGHGVGDQVLSGLAQVLTSCTRKTDTLARTGGEEFMLLMPMTDGTGVAVRAQRLCDTVSATPLMTDAGALTITISVGGAVVQVSDQSDDRLVSRADAALYRAKAGGRNRVEVDLAGQDPRQPVG